MVLKIGHLDVYILHSKCEKFPKIFVSCQNLLKRFNLTWFSLYFGLHPLFEPETKKVGIYQFYPIFSKKYVLNYENSLVTIKQNDILKKKLITLIFLMIYGLSSKSGCRGKLEKNQFVQSFWCYFEHLPNRRGISNFGRAERMYVDAQFSKPFGSSYFHWWE